MAVMNSVNQVATPDVIYSYELQVPTTNVFFNGSSTTLITFSNNAILIEYKNGNENARYTGNSQIVNFLNSVDASILGHTDWTIGNINIKGNEDIFVKDETTDISYTFSKTNIYNGKQVRVFFTITQKVNVNYYTCSVVENISSEDKVLNLSISDVVLGKDDFEISLIYHQNSNGNHYQFNDINYTTSLSKTTFSKNDTSLTSSPYRDTITISTSTYGNSFTYTHYFNVYFSKTKIISTIEVVGEDTNKYFVGKNNVFKTPTFQIKINYTDNTNETKSLSELGEIDYVAKGDVEDELTPNTSIITKDTQVELYIHSIDKLITYYIKLKEVEISNVEIVGFNSIVYGSCLRDYESKYKAKLTYNDNSVKENVNFTFDDSFRDITILKEGRVSIPSKVNVKAEGKTCEYTLPTTRTNPTYISIDASLSTLIKDISKIDLSKVYIMYGVFDVNNIWTKIYSKQLSLKNEDFTLTSSSFDTDELNGEKIIDNASGSYEITLTTNDVFDSSTTRTKTIDAKVKDYTDIKKWNLIVGKSEYAVGEKYLDNDSTKIEFSFGANESGAEIISKEKLSNLVSTGAFITLPQKNFKFTQITNSKEIIVKANFGDMVEKSYFINVEQEGVSNTTKKITLVPKFVSVLVIGTYMDDGEEEEETLTNVWALMEKNGNSYLSTATKYYYTDEDVCGYLINVNDKGNNGKVVLFKNYKNPLSMNSTNNMIVKFPCYVEGNSDKINKSTFGIMFGADNYNNRLFVSGNEDYPNCDWHTADVSGKYNEETDNESVNNLIYFSDLSEQQYGSSDSKVVGYDIVSDNKLLVLKEKSDKDKTIYFRTPTYNEDDNGLITEVFTVSKGNNSVAGINPHSIINFNGDTLFIDSDNTIQGLDLTGIQGDTQRYANSRSKLIDNLLKKKDLSNSILWSNNKYLLFTIDNYGTFITNYETKGDSQYEWWLVDYDNPKCFIEVGNSTYFGNNEGKLFRVSDKSFRDIHKIFIGKAQGYENLTIKPNPNEEQVILDYQIINQLNPTKKYTFKHYVDENEYKKNIYKRICSIGSENTSFDLYISNGVITSKKELIVREDRTYYLNMHCNSEGVVQIKWTNHENDFGVKYSFKYINEIKDGIVSKSTTKVELYREGVKCTDISNLVCADVCEVLDTEVEIKEINNQNCSIKLVDTDIVSYGEQGTTLTLFRGEISHKENVSAYYITAPLLANIQFTKTLWQFTLTNDSGLPSELYLSVSKNKMPKKDKEEEIGYGVKCFDYDEVDYDKMTFESIDIPRVFTRYKVIPNLKFVCFALKNDKDTNCVLTSMAITYTIPFPQV